MKQTTAHALHFMDQRAPEDIQVELERKLMVLLEPVSAAGQLVLRGEGKVTGCRCVFTLSLDEVLAAENLYTFRADFDWTGSDAQYDEYYTKTSLSWLGYWTSGFQRVETAGEDDVSSPRYRSVADKALHFESRLTTPEAVQREVVARMKDGHEFGTAHKEGGTRIRWVTGNEFVRSDTGDYPDTVRFFNQDDLLAHVRRFFDMEVTRPTYPDAPDELTAWKLILRQLFVPGG